MMHVCATGINALLACSFSTLRMFNTNLGPAFRGASPLSVVYRAFRFPNGLGYPCQILRLTRKVWHKTPVQPVTAWAHLCMDHQVGN